MASAPGGRSGRRRTPCRNRRATSRPCSTGGWRHRLPARSAYLRRNSPRCDAGSGNRCRLRRAIGRQRRCLGGGGGAGGGGGGGSAGPLFFVGRGGRLWGVFSRVAAGGPGPRGGGCFSPQ